MPLSEHIEELKSLRENFNWKIDEERFDLLVRLRPLADDWKVQFLDLRQLLGKEKIELLLCDSIKYSELLPDNNTGKRFVDFVIRTGYKDEPELDEDGKPVRCRTTPVHRLSRCHSRIQYEIGRRLFEIYDRFDVNHVDGGGLLTHFHAACEYGCDEAVEKFLDAGLDPNYSLWDSGWTSIHYALSSGRGKVAELLLRRGANPNPVTVHNYTPLHLIVRRNDDVLLKMFFEICDDIKQTVPVDVMSSGTTPLHTALELNKDKVIESLLRRGADPNLANGNGSRPLHFIFCKRFSPRKNVNDLLELFFTINEDIQQTVEVDGRDGLGNTPLHLATSDDDGKAVETLLRRGSDPNLANESGQTPLQMAVAKLSPTTIEVFLDNGADLSGFVFPAASCFGVKLKRLSDELWYDKTVHKLRLASGALAALQCLFKRGYELEQADALRIMKFLADRKLFEKSADLESNWYDHKNFALKAEGTMVKPDLSLYDLIQLRPKEAAKLLTYKDYLDLACSFKLRDEELPRFKRRHKRACTLHLCEKLSRGFFLQWALDPFWKLINYRLPIEICEIILERFTNKDLYHICLADVGRAAHDGV